MTASAYSMLTGMLQWTPSYVSCSHSLPGVCISECVAFQIDATRRTPHVSPRAPRISSTKDSMFAGHSAEDVAGAVRACESNQISLRRMSAARLLLLLHMDVSTRSWMPAAS